MRIFLSLPLLMLLVNCFRDRPPLPKALSFEGSERIVFFAVGDTGTGDQNQSDVALAMEQRCHDDVQGILILGDLFYMEGVSGSKDLQWQKKVWEPFDHPCLKTKRLFPIVGNHDVRGNIDSWFEMASKNPRWTFPRRFYRADFGNLLTLLVLDTTALHKCESELCSWTFLRRELRRPRLQWSLIAAHHPIRSSSAKSWKYRGGVWGWLLEQLICKSNATYLSGHAHHLEHIPIHGCDTHALISGGGGGELSPVLQRHDSPFAVSKHGFLELVFEKDQMKGSFFDKRGTTPLYTMTVPSKDSNAE